MIHEHALGHIKDITPQGEAIIIAPLPFLERALDRKYSEVEVIFQDGRRISGEQRRKVYALIGEIAEFVAGYRNSETIEETKNQRKWEFILERMESQERRLFSLSNCSVTLAREFITYLIDFIIKHDIPSSVSLLDNCEDIGAYIYACTMSRKCAVCGKEAQIHHVTGSKIQSGNDREKVHHLGREILPLCAVHHEQCHNNEVDFIERYHLQPIKLDEALCKKLGLKK